MSSEELIKLVQEIATNPHIIATMCSAIMVYTSGVATSYYKLKRDNKIENCKTIYEPNALKTIRKKRINPVQEELEDLIYEILTKLSFEVSPESMQIIKNNLMSVNDKSNYFDSLQQKYFESLGTYSGDHNIRVNKLFFLKANSSLRRQIISHELMHAASGYKYQNISGAGFCQSNGIGRGINEGYTDLISQRYFSQEIQETSYTYHKIISAITELVIGKQKMLDLYFHGNLKGLITELSKYQPEEKATQFILDLDTILGLKKNKYLKADDMLITLLNRVSIFLYDSFSNKMNQNKKYNDMHTYLNESKNFLELFSNMENEQHKLLNNKNKNNFPSNNKPKTLIRKNPNGYIDTIIITIVLIGITSLSILFSYLILKAS